MIARRTMYQNRCLDPTTGVNMCRFGKITKHGIAPGANPNKPLPDHPDHRRKPGIPNKPGGGGGGGRRPINPDPGPGPPTPGRGPGPPGRGPPGPGLKTSPNSWNTRISGNEPTEKVKQMADLIHYPDDSEMAVEDDLKQYIDDNNFPADSFEKYTNRYFIDDGVEEVEGEYYNLKNLRNRETYEVKDHQLMSDIHSGRVAFHPKENTWGATKAAEHGLQFHEYNSDIGMSTFTDPKNKRLIFTFDGADGARPMEMGDKGRLRGNSYVRDVFVGNDQNIRNSEMFHKTGEVMRNTMSEYPDYKTIDISGWSFGGYKTRTHTALLQNDFPASEGYNIKGYGINAHVSPVSNLPELKEPDSFEFHTILGDQSSVKSVFPDFKGNFKSKTTAFHYYDPPAGENENVIQEGKPNAFAGHSYDLISQSGPRAPTAQSRVYSGGTDMLLQTGFGIAADKSISAIPGADKKLGGAKPLLSGTIAGGGAQGTKVALGKAGMTGLTGGEALSTASILPEALSGGVAYETGSLTGQAIHDAFGRNIHSKATRNVRDLTADTTSGAVGGATYATTSGGINAAASAITAARATQAATQASEALGTGIEMTTIGAETAETGAALGSVAAGAEAGSFLAPETMGLSIVAGAALGGIGYGISRLFGHHH
jgi:hypothetical protein